MGILAGRRALVVDIGAVNGYLAVPAPAGQGLKLSEDGESIAFRPPKSPLGKPKIGRSNAAMHDRGALDGAARAGERCSSTYSPRRRTPRTRAGCTGAGGQEQEGHADPTSSSNRRMHKWGLQVGLA